MSSYKYVNGCYEITTDILPGFKRFRKCNAQYRVLYIGHDIIYQFVSYATKILQLTHNTKYDTWRCAINENCFNYSRTTSKQIGKFLREVNAPISSADIVNALGSCRGVTPSVAVYDVSDNVKIDIVSHDYLCDVWRY